MIECYKTGPEGTQRIDEPEAGCWINVTEPDDEDRTWLMDVVGIMPEFVRSAFDDEESSHVDFDDDTRQSLVIVDCPYLEDSLEAEDPTMTQYDTHPLSVLLLPEQDMVVTVSLRRNDVLDNFASGRVRQFNTNQRTRFLLQILLHISQRFLVYLRSIERQFNKTERVLRETMQNSELIKMLGLEKSLVYFSTSLKADEATLIKISNGRVIHLYDEDRELLDDVFIEIRQAIEMSNIYTNILNGTMETFGSVISNNLNIVMRTLTVITIVLAIPTIVFSFYGMNVDDLPMVHTFWAPAVISLVGAIIAAIYFRHNSLFK